MNDSTKQLLNYRQGRSLVKAWIKLWVKTGLKSMFKATFLSPVQYKTKSCDMVCCVTN